MVNLSEKILREIPKVQPWDPCCLWVNYLIGLLSMLMILHLLLICLESGHQSGIWSFAGNWSRIHKIRICFLELWSFKYFCVTKFIRSETRQLEGQMIFESLLFLRHQNVLFLYKTNRLGTRGTGASLIQVHCCPAWTSSWPQTWRRVWVLPPHLTSEGHLF